MALIDRIQVQFGAQEPWPKDVKLFQPYEVEQILLPDNANCLAVQAYLKMCNLEFKIESRPNAEFMSPTGKVPFIKCGAFVVAELDGIVSFVAQKGISLTEHLEPIQKSDLRAYQSLINNVLGNAENYVCWCDEETYQEVTKPRNGSVYPWPLNLIQTWSKRSKQIKHLKTLGWYEMSLKEVFQQVETCCQALTDRLENNTYFFGNKCTELDALFYGHFYTLLTTPIPAGGNSLAFLISKYDKLVDLVKRIDEETMGRHTVIEVVEWSRTIPNKIPCKNVNDGKMNNKCSAKEMSKNRTSTPIDLTDDGVTDCTFSLDISDIGDTNTRSVLDNSFIDSKDLSESKTDAVACDANGDFKDSKDGGWLLIDENETH